MTRASWGSTSGDLSGLFSGLISEEQRRIQESVQRDIQRSQEQQNAEDNDMYDKWQNGLISDDEWLDYVRSRVHETRGDPEQHKEWLKTFRDHRTAIHDAQMEARYEAGHLSIHKLIAHYHDRLEGVEPHSPEYRETQTRYFQLIDQRDSYAIEDGANHILNRIQRGEAGYGELRDFYQKYLRKVRRSSPLYRQIKQNLQSIANVAGATTAGGSSSGSSGGSSGGGSSSGYSSSRYSSSGGGDGSNDPYSAASKTVLKLWKSGNVFVPGGPDVVQSVLSAYKMDVRDDTTVWNALGEDSVVIEGLMDQAQRNPNAKFLVTPWGDRIPNTLANRHNLMNQGLRGYDYRIALGNSQGRSILGVLSARDSFVENTYQVENEATAEDYWKQVRQNFWERTELASQNPDPGQALSEYGDAGRILERAAHNILGEPLELPDGPGGGRMGTHALESEGVPAPPTRPKYTKSRLFPEEQVTEEMQGDLRYSIEVSRFLKDARYMSPEELQHESSILFDQRPEGYFLLETDLQQIIGTDQNTQDPTIYGAMAQVGTGLIGKAFANRGLQVTAALDRGETVPSTVAPYRYVGLPNAASPVAMREDMIGEILGVPDIHDESMVMGGWEKIGNSVQWVLRPLEDIKPPEWYFDDKGNALTPSEYEKLGHDPTAIGNAGYKSAPIQSLVGWKKLIDGDGNDWYRDPADGHLYENPPFQAGVFGPIFDYGAFVGSDGKIDMENFRLPASTGKGFIAFFTEDVSPRQAQMMTESILNNPLDDRINLEYFHRRDDKNFIQAGPLTPDDVVGMFWTPAPPLNMGGTTTPAIRESIAKQQHQAALDAAEIRRQAEVQEWIQTRIGNDKRRGVFEAMNPDVDLEQEANRGIERAQKMAGIRLGRDFAATKGRAILENQGAHIPRLRLRPAAPPSPDPIRPEPRIAPTVRRRKHRNTYVPDYTSTDKTDAILNRLP